MLKVGQVGLCLLPTFCNEATAPQRNYSLVSELQLERQLYRARAADLVQRIEATVGAAGAEAACQGLRRVAKLRTRKVVGRRAEVRMVEDIEELRPKKEADLLRNTKLPLNGEVELKRSEAAQNVSSKISLLSGGWKDESFAVENLAAGVLRPEEFQRYAWDDVRTVPQSCPRIERISAYHVHGRS